MRSNVGVVHSENHGTEKWRLGAGEVIGAIGIKNGPIVVDLKEEILHHASCEIESAVFKKAANNEVAVPTVHFIEASAWDDVRIGQVEQALHRKTRRINLAEAGNRSR